MTRAPEPRIRAAIRGRSVERGEGQPRPPAEGGRQGGQSPRHAATHTRAHDPWLGRPAMLFTTRQRVGNSHATCEREQAATLMVVATLPPLYAHRLGREPGPDSSRAALRATLAGPVDGLETDACLTADGRLVLLHDPWLSSCYDVTRLGARDGLERSAPRPPSRPRRHPDRARRRCSWTSCWTTRQVTFRCRSRSRPTAILSWHGLPRPRCAGWRARGRTAAVWRFSLSIRSRARRPRATGCRRGWSRGPTMRPPRSRDGRRVPGSAASASSTSSCTLPWSSACGSGGLSVTTGTVNDATLAARAAALGVDAITTDRPAALHHELAEMSQAA